MKTSPTSEETILPKAVPMITPTARSTTLPRRANSRNSFSMLMARSLGWIPVPILRCRRVGGGELQALAVIPRRLLRVLGVGAQPREIEIEPGCRPLAQRRLQVTARLAPQLVGEAGAAGDRQQFRLFAVAREPLLDLGELGDGIGGVQIAIEQRQLGVPGLRQPLGDEGQRLRVGVDPRQTAGVFARQFRVFAQFAGAVPQG